jgi:HSP20 family protein
MKVLIRNSSQYPGLLTNFLGRDTMGDIFPSASNGTAPAINVVENEEGYLIEIAAPGLQKTDFMLNLNHNRLTVSAHKEGKNEEKKGKYTRREFSYGAFQRAFTLPASTDSDQISANYTDGVLYIQLPKKEEAKVKPHRNIEIA